MSSIFSLLVVFLCCLKDSNSVNISECAGKKFDINESFCCGSTIYNRINGDGKRWDCCIGANKPYSNTQECCGSEIQNRSQFLGCCVSEFYDKSFQNCCKESGKVLNSSGPQACCGKNTFKPSTQLCCGDDNRLYEREANTECCGTRIYNTVTHDCVGNDYAVRKGFERCFNQEYNRSSEKEICCESGLIDVRSVKDYTCCYKNQIFPPSDTHYCLGYTVLRKNETLCGNDKINADTMICCNNHSHVRKYRQNVCCGTLLINAETRGCCNKEVTYRLDKRKCCGAKPIRKNQQCCGGSALRVQTHVCCNKTEHVPKQDPKHNQCCVNITFDNTTARCYNGKVVSQTDSFCGSKRMDAERDLCCEDRNLFKNAKKTKRCCAGRVIKASCKCCRKGLKRCCPKKKNRKQKKLTCQMGQRWSDILDLVESGDCLKQAFIVKKRKKVYQQQKQFIGKKERHMVSWKLGQYCDFINKKKFVIAETSTGNYYAIRLNRRNKQRLKHMKKNCVRSKNINKRDANAYISLK